MKYVLYVTAMMWTGLAVAAPAQAEDWPLSTVLQRVEQANRDVQTAQRAVDAARADQQSAGVTPPAQFSLLSQAIDPNKLGSGSAWHRPIDTIARIDKMMERGGKADWRVRSAEAGLQAALQDQADALRTRKLAAAQAYWDLKLAQEQMAASEHNWQLAQTSRDTAQLRLSQGDLSRLEATRLSVEAERAANELAQSRQQLNQARSALAQWLAMGNTPALRASDNWPDTTTPEATQDNDAWLAARPDVQAATRRVEQAQSALSLAQSQRSTDVTWSVQFEHNPGVAARLWGVGVAFPLGVDGRQDGPVARALIAMNEAQAQLDKTRADALADRALQADALNTAMERIQRLEARLLPQARDALKGVEYARQQGALPLQDVLDARRALHAAELDTAAAHADAAKALAALTMTSDTN
ncbi:MAG: TolC family protein [Aquabacterium sp.]|uniref:TolC family protein n=1 Tax=Aquabacterium sp. TaxID=1872578 RepID=UPI001200A53D|nr:TolC family protein [Aquabacterium sp.]TAK88724.1 MAG: TolC family protein [Aquabacterium sp.]